MTPTTPKSGADLQEFVDSLVALRQSLADEHGENLGAGVNLLMEVNKRFSRWLKQHRPALQRLTAALSEVLEKLPEWHENLEANMILLERGLDVLRTEGFSSTGFVFSTREVLDYGTASTEEVNTRLLALTQGRDFHGDLVRVYRSSGLRPERLPLIEEALTLHREGRFAGATVLSYSQLEGILTDALVAIGGAVPAGPFKVSSAAGQTLSGLHPKLKCIEGRVGSTRVFSELLQSVLSNADPDSTVSRTRNYVLHGADTSFATSQRSTQIVLWMLAVLIELRSVLPLERTHQ